ncbi:hypothetical protein AKJ16_DCAP03331 [Drosera capensis]
MTLLGAPFNGSDSTLHGVKARSRASSDAIIVKNHEEKNKVDDAVECFEQQDGGEQSSSKKETLQTFLKLKGTEASDFKQHDTSGIVHNTDNLFDLFDGVVNEIGEDDIVQASERPSEEFFSYPAQRSRNSYGAQREERRRQAETATEANRKRRTRVNAPSNKRFLSCQNPSPAAISFQHHHIQSLVEFQMVCCIAGDKMAVMARVLEAGSFSNCVAEKSGQQKLAALYIDRQLRDADEANLLDEEDMYVFDLKPLSDPLQLHSLEEADYSIIALSDH